MILRALVVVVALLLPRIALAANAFGGYEQLTGTFTSVSATFRVPYASPPGAGVVIWAGIFSNSQNLIVQGIINVNLNSNGTTSYNAEYAIADGSSIVVDNVDVVTPGDTVVITTACTTNCTANQSGMTWQFTVHDVTAGWTWTPTPIVQPMSISEAGWFVEQQGLTSNFGSIPFVNCTANGANPSFTTGQKLSGTDGGGFTLTPSNPDGTSDGFNVCWGSGSSSTPCTAAGSLAVAPGGRNTAGF